MISLPEITLCCIDTRFPELGFEAVTRSCREISFGEVIFVTNHDFTVPDNGITRLRVHRIDNIVDIETYSTFMIKRLAGLVSTSHCLVIQWDGFVIHPEGWDRRFLDYDYIGSPWLTKEGPIVGNGGFSLRSSRLLEALTYDEIVPHHPEDDCICVTNRKLLESAHDIVFAPAEIARSFSFEFTAYERQFGFHGMSNFPDVLDEEELLGFVEQMPESIFVNEYFIGFCKKIAARHCRCMPRLSKRLLAYVTHKEYATNSRQQHAFLVESLLHIGLYRQALAILADRKYGLKWKATYPKILLRKALDR